MSYAFEEWEDFEARARTLVQQDPRTRVVVKYAHNKERLDVRVTNDIVCLKFHTSEASDLRKFERLHTWILSSSLGFEGGELEKEIAAERKAAEEESRAALQAAQQQAKKGGRRKRR